MFEGPALGHGLEFWGNNGATWGFPYYDAAQSGLDDYVYTMRKDQLNDIEAFESWGTVFVCALKAPLRDLPVLPKV